ncbi:MAG: phospholipase [Anaerolineales bacterium]
MQAATNTELIEFNGWTLRVRKPNAAKPNLLVMLHGWTGDENSMWIFTRGLQNSYWMIAPRAPHPAEPSGYSWRLNDPNSFGRPSFEKLQPAAEALIKLIDAYATAEKLDAAQFDVMGFSQGAAMTNLLGILYPQRVRKMGVLAGFLPSGAESLLPQKPLAGKNIFVAHGTLDEMVRIERARESIALLEQAGARITYCEDEVGHKLSAHCLRALENYLRDE